MFQIHRRLPTVLAVVCLAGLLGCQPVSAPEPNTTQTVSPEKSPPKAEAKPEHKHTNRLAKEKSPYLRQHMHNPVDWYPWGEEAFAKARKENKPIFLSVGYSTCHWCHVMERESFEDEKVGEYVNQHFVCIKMDREERPDVDKIYMTYVQATTGSGGWPMTVFLTPDLKPFFGGTYFPPVRRSGRPSFMDLCQRITELWKTKADEIISGAEQAHEQISKMSGLQPDPAFVIQSGYLTNALNTFKGQYDSENGGFDRQPKFPRPSVPRFVLQQGVRLNDQEAIKMILHTCDEMAAGGINDQIGGGFSRYSVDRYWLVPHFEKMLYDNAQLIQLYLDAYLVSGEKRHADVVRNIIRYVLRDMVHPKGGFYSAEDADSEGQEGKFYCWTVTQLKELLSEAEFKVAERYFGITEHGNFEDHSHPQPLKNLNVLSIVDPKLTDAESKLLSGAKKKMFDARVKRIRPHLDDKVLASWNGLMLGAIARASAVLDEPEFLAAAEKNVAFLKASLWDNGSRTMYHRWRDGERDRVQLLDAYSSMLDGVLHLYEATLKPTHLEFGIQLADAMLKRFYDEKNGGFFQNGDGDTNLVMRLKEDYDGAEPSGNSVATLALLRLSKITDRKDFREKAEKTFKLFGRNLEKAPQVIPYMMSALDFDLHEPFRVVVTGKPEDPATRKLIVSAHSVYQPNKVILGNTGPVEEFAKTLEGQGGPTVYLCTGTACKPPTRDVKLVAGMLKEIAKAN